MWTKGLTITELFQSFSLFVAFFFYINAAGFTNVTFFTIRPHNDEYVLISLEILFRSLSLSLSFFNVNGKNKFNYTNDIGVGVLCGRALVIVYRFVVYCCCYCTNFFWVRMKRANIQTTSETHLRRSIKPNASCIYINTDIWERKRKIIFIVKPS